MSSCPGVNPSNCPRECEENNHPGAQHPSGQPQDKVLVAYRPTLPTVGRTVHYHPANSTEPIAGIVNSLTDVSPECVNLTLFLPDGTTKLARYVHQTDVAATHCWSWPAR